MLFYVTLFIASIFVSFIILWVYRLVVDSTNRISTHHLPNASQDQIVRNGIKLFSSTHKTTPPHKIVKPRSASSKLAGKRTSPKANWGWKPNVGYPSRNHVSGLSGQAYKPSEQAIQTFALKARDD